MDTQARLYATDLTNAEWTLIEPFLPAEASTGRPRIHARRTILNAIFYVLRNRRRLRVALPASGVAGVANRLWLLSPLALGWDVGAHPSHAASAAPPPAPP